MFLQKNNSKGFTLIELLVVIAIIGLLSSVVMASLNGARSKARDTYRKSQMRQLETALELYRTSNNKYPITNEWWGVCQGGLNKTTSGPNAYIPGLTPTYMPVLPVDPSGDKTGWSGFLYKSDGVNYKIVLHSVGPESFPTVGQMFYDPGRPTWAWMVCSGEPACSSW